MCVNLKSQNQFEIQVNRIVCDRFTGNPRDSFIMPSHITVYAFFIELQDSLPVSFALLPLVFLLAVVLLHFVSFSDPWHNLILLQTV